MLQLLGLRIQLRGAHPRPRLRTAAAAAAAAPEQVGGPARGRIGRRRGRVGGKRVQRPVDVAQLARRELDRVVVPTRVVAVDRRHGHRLAAVERAAAERDRRRRSRRRRRDRGSGEEVEAEQIRGGGGGGRGAAAPPLRRRRLGGGGGEPLERERLPGSVPDRRRRRRLRRGRRLLRGGVVRRRSGFVRLEEGCGLRRRCSHLLLDLLLVPLELCRLALLPLSGGGAVRLRRGGGGGDVPAHLHLEDRAGIADEVAHLRKRQLLDLAPLQRDEVVALAQLPAVVGDVGWGDHIEVDAALVLAHLDLEAPLRVTQQGRLGADPVAAAAGQRCGQGQLGRLVRVE
mmetsp:Transcript_11566/g.34578  ORF Transcript_11566/g.34578 Transcript_11566/m.34578 type:complete len:343 (-) Transcript_11566:647-1675(-)